MWKDEELLPVDSTVWWRSSGDVMSQNNKMPEADPTNLITFKS